VPLGRPLADGSQARQHALRTSVLLLAAGAVFAPVVGNDFVFDDVDFLQHGEMIQSGDGLWRGFVEPYWEVAGVDAAQPYYRPLGVAAFTLLWRLGDGQPWAFHLAALLLHAACGVAVMRLALACSLPPLAAWAASLLFTLHPAQVQAVAWGTCLTELASTGCVLAALLAWRSRRAPACGLWLLAGMACKETAAAGVPILVLAELAALGGPASRRMLGWIAASAAGYAVLRLRAVCWDAAIPAFTPAQTIGGLDARARVVDLVAWLGRQSLRLCSPWAMPPFPDPLEPSRWNAPRFAASLGAGVLLLLAPAVAWARTRARPCGGVVLLALLIVVIAQVPALLTGDRARPPLADRFLHLPLAGGALLAGAAIASSARTGLVVAFAIAAGAAVQSASALSHWRNDEALFRWAVQADPRQALPWCGHAQTLLARAQRFPLGDPARQRLAAEAIAALERGAELVLRRPLTPRIADDQLRSALGHAWYVQGDLFRAERRYREVLADHPGSLGARLGLACVLGLRGEHAGQIGLTHDARRSLLAARALFASLDADAPHAMTTARLGAAEVERLLAVYE
jgi:hypothetical protein